VRYIVGCVVAGLASVTLAASATANPVPIPDPNIVGDVLPRPCAYEGKDPYEKRFYRYEGWKGPNYERYPGACRRLRFAYGPITVKPGQNDVLVSPLTIEKPSRDGYITRFKPDLVRADGTVPPIEELHLHHGTWISYPSYGSGPFFAAGEEKTVAPYPKGYGMPVKATDQWQLLYMVHSQIAQAQEVYITYDVDFIPEDKAEQRGIKPAYPIWLDVRPSAYPVFNSQRGFGKDGECTWPKQKCAAFDPYGKELEGQGKPGNGKGTDWEFPDRGETLGKIESFTGGTLIGIGGHLHPGGIQNEIKLVRGRKSKRIYTGKAAYWKRKDASRPGGPPTSWDFSMRVIGKPYWGVRVKPGDKLRSNVTYDTKIQSTYENMGIAVTLLAPDTPGGKRTAKGLNPFKAPTDKSTRCRSRGLAVGKLCNRGGVVTHGHLSEAENFGGPATPWDARRGSPTGNVAIANFLYNPGDLSTISMTGLPTVKLGSTVSFTNAEAAAIYHTVTSCRYPCKGQTGTAYPLANGKTSEGRKLDFDSSELAIGPSAIGPASNRVNWRLPVTKQAGFKPGEVVTYYCRVHPSMRGAFEVTR
jgi:plastocyanin